MINANRRLANVITRGRGVKREGRREPASPVGEVYNRRDSLDSLYSNAKKQISNMPPKSMPGSRRSGVCLIAIVFSVVTCVMVRTAAATVVPDPSFGNKGIVTPAGTSGFDAIYGSAAQNDNKIVVVGEADARFVLARYNTDGTLDARFGTAGIVRLYDLFWNYSQIGNSDGSRQNARLSIALQSDGKIVVAGNNANLKKQAACLVLRFNIDGTADTTFGDRGRAYGDFSNNGNYNEIDVRDVRMQSDGKILVVETSEDFKSLTVARFNSNGTVDASFGTLGQARADLSDISNIVNAEPWAVAVQSDGKVVVAGGAYYFATREFPYATTGFCMARFKPDGTLDSGFGTNGKVTSNIVAGQQACARDVKIQIDGKIVVAGSTFISGDNSIKHVALARYNINGTLDTTFNGSGMVNYDGGGSSEVSRMVIQPNGAIAVAGSRRLYTGKDDFLVARFLPNGHLDATFDATGSASTDFFGKRDNANTICLQSDGRIVAAGLTSAPATDRDFALARYLPNGALDTSFGEDGKVTTPLPAAAAIRVIKTLADGKFLTLGSIGGSFFLARYNADGNLDPAFGFKGMLTPEFDEFSGGTFRPSLGLLANAGIAAAEVQSDGKLVVAGGCGTQDIYLILQRYNADGSLDVSFNSKGTVVETIKSGGFTYSEEGVSDLALDSRGRLIPLYKIRDGDDIFWIVSRFRSDGSLDTTYGSKHDGFTEVDINRIAFAPNGNLYGAGRTGTSPSDFALVRFGADGRLDSTFGKAGIIATDFGGSDTAYQLLFQPDDKVILGGGNVHVLNGNAINQPLFARYLASGALDVSFGKGGKLVPDFGGASVNLTIALQADGKMVGAGTIQSSNLPMELLLTRFNVNGSVDDAFNAGGRFMASFGQLRFLPALALQDGGDILTSISTAGPPPATMFGRYEVVGETKKLLNISTRMEVLNGNNVLIGGFIVTGTQPKKVMIRALGPSLPVSGKLADPVLELHDKTGVFATNDNWKIDEKTGQSQQAEIEATTIPPKNELESALVATLPANNSAYTAIVRGQNGGTGVGQVEVYDLSTAANSQLANISTRGFVDTGDNVMIGGVIVGPNSAGSTKVLLRAIGPSLGISGALADPTLELHNGNGATIATNDNWKIDDKTGGSQQAEIEATKAPPQSEFESALIHTVTPGNYTAIVRGKNKTTGIGLVEVYNLQ
jgi:uncharacterized delta-60 repeat protein